MPLRWGRVLEFTTRGPRRPCRCQVCCTLASIPYVPQPLVGVPGSLHQKFRTLEEAAQFIITVQAQGQSQPLYAVRKGRRPGVYTDWETCRSQVYSMFHTSRYGVSSLTQWGRISRFGIPKILQYIRGSALGAGITQGHRDVTSGKCSVHFSDWSPHAFDDFYKY